MAVSPSTLPPSARFIQRTSASAPGLSKSHEARHLASTERLRAFTTGFSRRADSCHRLCTCPQFVRCLTGRSSGPPPARHLAREPV